MKNYKETEQAFGVGDIAMLHDPARPELGYNEAYDWKVKILECGQDEDGCWWYVVTPVEFQSMAREVPQNRLEAIA